MRSSKSKNTLGHRRKQSGMIDRWWKITACASVAAFVVAFSHLAHQYVLVGGQYLRIVLP